MKKRLNFKANNCNFIDMHPKVKDMVIEYYPRYCDRTLQAEAVLNIYFSEDTIYTSEVIVKSEDNYLCKLKNKTYYELDVNNKYSIYLEDKKIITISLY